MQLTIDLPDSFQLYNQESLLKEVRLSIALIFFQQKKISIGKAIQIANLSIYEFQKECQKNKIPVKIPATLSTSNPFNLLIC